MMGPGGLGNLQRDIATGHFTGFQQFADDGEPDGIGKRLQDLLQRNAVDGGMPVGFGGHQYQWSERAFLSRELRTGAQAPAVSM